jgi:putative transposase
MHLVWAKELPVPYVPKDLLALDTNESSLDGVHLPLAPSTGKPGNFVRAQFPDIRRIQTCAFLLRVKLGSRKADDRRLARLLLGKVGRREHHRVEQRLHLLINRLLAFAEAHRAAIALEDLTHPVGKKLFGGKGLRWRRCGAARSMRRRLSNWPRRELHRLIRYKAEDRGVPMYFVDPRNTSKTCPRCGVISDRRKRVGAIFDCAACGWRSDRQLNAGLNIARIARAERPELGGLMLDPDALPKEVRIPLYPPATADGHERSGREGRDSRPSG